MKPSYQSISERTFQKPKTHGIFHPKSQGSKSTNIGYKPSGNLKWPWKPWSMEIDDFPSDRNLHLWLGFNMAMLNSPCVDDLIKHGEWLFQILTRGVWHCSCSMKKQLHFIFFPFNGTPEFINLRGWCSLYTFLGCWWSNFIISGCFLM